MLSPLLFIGILPSKAVLFNDVVEAHCYFVDIRRTDCEQTRCRINNMIAGRFGHVGLCQLRTKLKKLQCETCYIANIDHWCCVMKSGRINGNLREN